jgi:hypothetical protein
MKYIINIEVHFVGYIYIIVGRLLRVLPPTVAGVRQLLKSSASHTFVDFVGISQSQVEIYLSLVKSGYVKVWGKMETSYTELVRLFCSSCVLAFWPRARRVFLNFLGAITKLRKTTIRSVIFVRLSVRMDHLGSRWTDFYEIWYLIIFRKYVEKFLFWLQCDK